MIETIKELSEKVRQLADALCHLPAALRLIAEATGMWALIWVFLLLARALIPVATVYVTKLLVDSFVNAIDAKAVADTGAVLFWAALMAGLMFSREALSSFANVVRTAQSERLQDHVSQLVHLKSMSVDLGFYDTAEYHDRLYRAHNEAAYRTGPLLDNLGSLLSGSVTMVGMVGLLLPFGAWVPLMLIGSTLPGLYVVARYGLIQHSWQRQTTADVRRCWYYDSLMTDNTNAAELRVLGTGDHFSARYQAIRARLRRERLDIDKARAFAEFGAATGNILITWIAVGAMALSTLQGALSFGDLVLFYQAFQQAQYSMRSLLDQLGHGHSNLLFLGDLFEFLAIEPRIKDPLKPITADISPRNEIRLDGISFRYPGNDRQVLEDFCMTMRAGSINALVGANGSGKSTVIKLLCRLYDPDAGSITIDGTDLRDIGLTELRRHISIMLQEPVHYNTTLHGNVAIGNLFNSENVDWLATITRVARVDEIISRLPSGERTILGNSFLGGIELSTGEWQRVALARALVRRAPIILLDEPTSALDSWGEASWMKRLRKIAAGQTVLVVTHRLTTAMQADTIHVMDKGRVVDSGRHEELLGRQGSYARAWQAQMETPGFPPRDPDGQERRASSPRAKALLALRDSDARNHQE